MGMFKMSRKVMMVGAMVGAGVIGFSASQFGSAYAQQDAGGAVDPMGEEAMAKWMELGQPGKHHEVFKHMEGKWDCVTTMWMDPDSEPEIGKATYEAKTVLGGRYLVGKFKGEFMGEPFEGLSMMAYDNYQEKYIDVWVDSMSTGMFQSEGKATGNAVITMRGEMPEPMTGGTMKSKHVMDCSDKNKITMTMHHSLDDGKTWMKAMMIEYTRAE